MSLLDISINFGSIISISTICLALAIIFFLLKLSKRTNVYLPLLFYAIITVIESGLDLIVDSELLMELPHVLYLSEPFNMLPGLVIFLYARSQEQLRFELTRKDIYLIIPFIFGILVYMPYYTLSGSEKLADFMEYGALNTDVDENIWEWLFDIVINVLFLNEALKRINVYDAKIKEQSSDIQKTDLHLTKLLIKLCVLAYGTELIIVFMTYYGFPYYNEIYETLSLFRISILFLVGYDAIRSSKYINELQQNWVKLPMHVVELETTEVVKYAKSTLTDESAEQIKLQLEQFMTEKKPYLETQLRIKDLSEMIGISSHQISQVINEAFQQNFFEFVNHYRIQDSMQLLKDPAYEKFTLTAIGFEVGFNSKSAFYNAFKKVTGQTPLQFKSSLK
ncbi:AraC family transcriptional regulator [Puteibacter caeruleilacunae]|nr:AraC family transcriptional regulator [Puteibacter caeruleilacunae]